MEKVKMKLWKKILLTLMIIIVILILTFISYKMYLRISDKIDIDRRYSEFEKIQTIETKGALTYIEDEELSKVENMDYIMQDGIGVKVDSVKLNDDTCSIEFNFKLDEEFKYETFGYSYAIYDEEKNIYHISGRMHLGENEKYDYGFVFMKRELGLDKIDNLTGTFFADSSTFKIFTFPFFADSSGMVTETINKDEKIITNKLEIGAEDKFPLSKKIYIKIFDLGYYTMGKDENGKPTASSTSLTNAKWLFELDIPEEVNKRDTINLKLAEEIPGLEMTKIAITDTKLVLNFNSEEYRNLITAGKDMVADEFTNKTKEMLSITDGEGNVYKELSGGTRGEKGYKMTIDANKNDLEKKLFIKYSSNGNQYKVELIKDE